MRPWLLTALALLAAAVLAVALVPLAVFARLALAVLPARCGPPLRLFLLLAGYIAVFQPGTLAGCLWLRWRCGRAPRDVVALRHEELLGRMTTRLVTWIYPLAGLRLRIHSDDRIPEPDRPVVVLVRHAGVLNSQHGCHLVVSVLRRRLFSITKRRFTIDPAIGTVVGPTGVASYRWNAAGRTQALRYLLGWNVTAQDGDAMVVFPEGMNLTAGRRKRAIAKLRDAGRPDRAALAETWRQVLPPFSGGPHAALCTRQRPDAVIVAHTGLEDLLSWAIGLADRPRTDGIVDLTWWRVPAAEIPSGRAEFEEWLDSWWQRVDDWIGRSRSGGDVQDREDEVAQLADDHGDRAGDRVRLPVPQ